MRVAVLVRAVALFQDVAPKDLLALGIGGDKGFEFYNQRNVKDFIQIPWEEVDYVIASVILGGRYIPRFVIRTKKNGDYAFAAKKPKIVLKAINKYIPSDHMVRSLTFWDVVKSAFTKKK